MKAKIITAAIIGAASMGVMQTASASWVNTACPGSPPGTPCIQYHDANVPTDYSFNIHDGDRTKWHGKPNTGTAGTWNNGVNPADPFPFSGDTHLSCGVSVDCDLELSGYVNITGSNPYDIGIMVTGADVTGGLLCAGVTVSGFPWFIAPNSYDGPYTNPPVTGVPYSSPMTLVGSIGPIGVQVPLLGINVVNGHMHDVGYNNSTAFSFGVNGGDPVIYNSDETPSDCTVSGTLTLEPAGDTLTIY